MKKKSQAAMEFLMTYGWAILVVLVAISALAYFGVLDRGRYMPTVCYITQGIDCVDSSIEMEGGFSPQPAFKFAFINNMGAPVQVHQMDFQSGSQYSVGTTNEVTNVLTACTYETQMGPISVLGANSAPVDSKVTCITKRPLKKNDVIVDLSDRHDIDFRIYIINMETGLKHTYNGQASKSRS